MLYFGQEVGEPGAGEEGFQTDDGRTTIFDYWGVPEHQKWMNGGAFDGGALSDEQKQLRRTYSELLTFAVSSEALAEGDYLDITAHNVSAGNFGEDVHAFLRYSRNEKLLIVNSFNETDQEIQIQIPREGFAQMGLDAAEAYIARDMLWREAEVGLDDELSFSLKLRPYSSFIFKIK
jgi:hypothetical protein